MSFPPMRALRSSMLLEPSPRRDLTPRALESNFGLNSSHMLYSSPSPYLRMSYEDHLPLELKQRKDEITGFGNYSLRKPENIRPPPVANLDLRLPQPHPPGMSTSTTNHETDFKFSRQQRFKQDLDEQVRLKQERIRREHAEMQKQVAREEAEMRAYNPFGRGGAGAPLRDASGNVVAEIRQFKNQSVQREWNTPRDMENQALNNNTQLVHGSEATPRPTSLETNVHSRFQFDSAIPEVRKELQEKIRKQQEVERMLREQLEEKARRKRLEKERELMEEQKEMERLEREREELRLAYEREKTQAGRPDKQSTPSEDGFPPRDAEQVNKIARPPLQARMPKEKTPSSPIHLRLDRIDEPKPKLVDFELVRRELLQEHDSLREQLRKQEDILRTLKTEMELVRKQNEEQRRREPTQPKHESHEPTFQTPTKPKLQLVSKSKFISADSEPIDELLGSTIISPGPKLQAYSSSAPVRTLDNEPSPSQTEELETETDPHDIAADTDQLDRLLQAFVLRRYPAPHPIQ